MLIIIKMKALIILCLASIMLCLAIALTVKLINHLYTKWLYYTHVNIKKYLAFHNIDLYWLASTWSLFYVLHHIYLWLIQ